MYCRHFTICEIYAKIEVSVGQCRVSGLVCNSLHYTVESVQYTVQGPTLMSAPAMKQPGLPDMRTADLAVGSAMN